PALDALLEGLRSDEDRAGIGAVRPRRAREAGEGDGEVDARSIEDHLARLLDHGVRALERGAVRKLDRDDQVAHVLRGDEAGRDVREAEARQDEEGDVDGEAERGAAHEPADGAAVGRAETLEAV